MSTPTSKEEPKSRPRRHRNAARHRGSRATSTDSAAASRAFSVEGITQAVSSVRVGRGYLWASASPSFGLFVALLSPVSREHVDQGGAAQPGQPRDGRRLGPAVRRVRRSARQPRSSERSRTARAPAGVRRRPWMIGGVVVFVGALAWLAYSPDVLQLTLAWVLAQVSANAVLATLTASFADNVPEFQRGKASSVIALAQKHRDPGRSVLACTSSATCPSSSWRRASWRSSRSLVYAVICRDDLPTTPIKPFSWLNLISSFWTNPIKHRDFGLAWWGRFLITFGTFMFTTYRLLYMQDRIGLEQKEAVGSSPSVCSSTPSHSSSAPRSPDGCRTASAAARCSSGAPRRSPRSAWSSWRTSTPSGVLLRGDRDGLRVRHLRRDRHRGSSWTSCPTRSVRQGPRRHQHRERPAAVARTGGRPFLLGIGGGQNYTLMLWGAGVAVLLGALVIFPIKSVK